MWLIFSDLWFHSNIVHLDITPKSLKLYCSRCQSDWFMGQLTITNWLEGGNISRLRCYLSIIIVLRWEIGVKLTQVAFLEDPTNWNLQDFAAFFFYLWLLELLFVLIEENCCSPLLDCWSQQLFVGLCNNFIRVTLVLRIRFD